MLTRSIVKGGLESLSSFRSAVLVAGGVGITHQLLYIRELIARYHNRSAAIRRITLVWSIRTLGKFEIWNCQKRRQYLPLDSALAWICTKFHVAQVESVHPFLQALLTQHAQSTRRENLCHCLSSFSLAQRVLRRWLLVQPIGAARLTRKSIDPRYQSFLRLLLHP